MSDVDSLAQRSARAMGWNWVGSAVRAMLQFVVQIALARLLGPDAFGQAAAVLLVVGLGSLVAEVGLGAALVQQAQLDDSDIGFALAWILASSVVVMLVIALLAQPIALLLGDARLGTLVLASALAVPLQALTSLPMSLMQRGYRARRWQAIQVASYALAYGTIGVPLALQGWGAWSLLAAFAAHAGLVVAMGWASLRFTLRPRWTGHAALRAYGRRTLLANLVNWAIESVDRLLVSRGWGAAALGEYALAANLSRAPVTLLVGSLQPVAFASSSRLQDEPLRLARGYLALLTLALLATVPTFAFFAWHADAIVALLYGPRWAGAAAPFAWLCLGVPFFAMLALTGPMLRGVGAVGGEVRAQLAVLVLLAVALGWLMGKPLVFAAAAVALASALRAALLYRALRARVALPAKAMARAWGGALALAAIVCASCLAVALAGASGLGALFISAALALPLCLAALRWSRGALLGEELAVALRNRRGDSRAARWLCTVVNLA